MTKDIIGRLRGKRRGSILLLAMFFLIVLLTLSIAFFRIIPAEFHSADQSRKNIQATYAADSGARHAVAWLQFKIRSSDFASLITDTEIESYNTNNFGTAVVPLLSDADRNNWDTNSTRVAILNSDTHKVDENWSFLSRIAQDDSDFFRRIFAIETCAYLRTGPNSFKPMHVTKVVVQNESFAEYALFISDWKNDFIYTMAPNGIQGPLHTNGYPRLAAPNTAFWTDTKADGTPEDPWVSGPLARITRAANYLTTSTEPAYTLDDTVEGDGVLYANGNAYAANQNLVPYEADGAPIPESYSKIVKDGRENIRTVQHIPIPEENTSVRLEAWGRDATGAPIDIPNNNGNWNTASNGQADTVLVNTVSGVANVPDGEVAGGIFIRKKNAELLLDITPEGHQKIRVRQGNVTVTDPTRNSAYIEEPTYHRPVVHAATTRPGNWFCADPRTRPHYDRVWTSTTTTENGPHSSCDPVITYVAGEDGINTTITSLGTCDYEVVTWTYEDVENGTEDWCADWDRGPDIPVPEWTEWVDADAGDAGAELDGGTERVTVPEGTPGATVVTGTRNIEKWSSVVEVNSANDDTPYNIPYYDGVKVNGVTASGPSDPILTVADGKTVTIKNDYRRGGQANRDASGVPTNASHQDFSEYTVMNGRTNGIVFSDVHLWDVRGTSKGAKYEDANGNLKYQGRLLSTNVAGKKMLEIQDSILQYYDGDGTYVDANGDTVPINDGRNRVTPGADTPNPDHVLGILAGNVDIDPRGDSQNFEDGDNLTGNARDRYRGDSEFLGGYFRGGINVYAVIMAGRTKSNGEEEGGFGANSKAMRESDGDGLGDFNLYGGLISAESRKTQDNLQGFRLGLNYDEIAAASIPFFPQTPEFKPLRYVTYEPD